MNKRPLAVTIISVVFIVTGTFGLAFHLADFWTTHPFQYDILWISFVRLLAVIGGVYMLRANNWARWLSIAWIAVHVVLSFFHTKVELAVHVVLCAAIAYFLFRPEVNEYFRATA